MRSVDLNFASTPFRNNTPYILGYGLGTLALCAFTLFNGWAFFHYSQGRRELEAERSGKTVKIQALYNSAAKLQEQIKKQNIDAMNSRAAFTNALLDRRRFSWTDLLNSLEEVQPYQVRLLSLLPRIQDKGIVIEARAVAKDLQAFANFQQNLLNDPRFRRVYPGGFLRNTDDGELIFNLAFNYFPEGAPVDVQGLRPNEIREAPGKAGGPSYELDQAEEPPPPEPGAGSRAGGPSRGAKENQARVNPAGPGPAPGGPRAGLRPVPTPVPAPVQPPPVPPGAKPPAGDKAGADPQRSASNPAALATTTIGAAPGPSAAQPPVQGGPADAKKARWMGRGAIPGTNGMRPDMKTPVPGNTVPVAKPEEPPPDDADEDSTEDDE